MRTQEKWIQLYSDMGAYWMHDGNPKRPHAILTSRKHSAGYFNGEIVCENTLVKHESCEQLVGMFPSDAINSIDRVVGPAFGAITLADSIAFNIAILRGRTCFMSYATKIKGDGKIKEFEFVRTSMPKQNEVVLLVEDTLTTGGSVNSLARAVMAKGATVLPFVGALVNRSESKILDGREAYSLIYKYMPTWDTKEDCHACNKLGSEAIEEPKSKESWARLNATYE
ncbi:MAG: hypothetical protein WC477_06575 [Patescibacteria group bacterium]